MAIASFDIAITLNPDHGRARINRDTAFPDAGYGGLKPEIYGRSGLRAPDVSLTVPACTLRPNAYASRSHWRISSVDIRLTEDNNMVRIHEKKYENLPARTGRKKISCR